MDTLTKKYIFEQKLKGKPIYVHVNEISDKEIQLLFKCKILQPWGPQYTKNVFIAVALYPIANGQKEIRNYGGTPENPMYKYFLIPPGEKVTLRKGQSSWTK